MRRAARPARAWIGLLPSLLPGPSPPAGFPPLQSPITVLPSRTPRGLAARGVPCGRDGLGPRPPSSLRQAIIRVPPPARVVRLIASSCPRCVDCATAVSATPEATVPVHGTTPSAHKRGGPLVQCSHPHQCPGRGDCGLCASKRWRRRAASAGRRTNVAGGASGRREGMAGRVGLPKQAYTLPVRAPRIRLKPNPCAIGGAVLRRSRKGGATGRICCPGWVLGSTSALAVVDRLRGERERERLCQRELPDGSRRRASRQIPSVVHLAVCAVGVVMHRRSVTRVIGPAVSCLHRVQLVDQNQRKG